MILISPTSLGAGIGPPRLKRFVVTGFFHSGMYDFDSTLVFVALKDGRALLADDASLESGLELRLAQHVRRAGDPRPDCGDRGT